MKTVTGRVISAEPISLYKAAKLLSVFASSDNDASQDVRAYLLRASDAFTGLKSFHRKIKSEEKEPRSIDEVKEEKKKKKKKKIIEEEEEEDVDKKVNEKLEEEQMNEDRKERKKEKKNKKRKKSDQEMGSEERKSKKQRKFERD